MDKKLHEYPDNKTDLQDSQDSQESPSTHSRTSRSNLSEKSSTTLDKRNKKRKKAKSNQIPHGSSNIWRNLSHIFSKSTITNSEVSAEVVKEKIKGSTLRRLSSIFSHRKSSKDAVTTAPNIGVSPIGYQAAISKTNFRDSQEKEIAMAVRLPSGSTTENVAVTVELEAVGNCEEAPSDDNSDDATLMKCLEETESKTIFTGVLRVPPHTDFGKLANMPLYIVDSNEELVFQPGAEISYRKIIRPSEEMLRNDNEGDLRNMGTIKIKVRLDKISKMKKGLQLSISSINAEKDLKDRSSDVEKYTPERSQSVKTVAEMKKNSYVHADALEKMRENAAPTEVKNVNESANHTQESTKRATDLGSISKKSTPSRSEEIESIEYSLANSIVNDTLDVAANGSKTQMYIKLAQQEITENYNDREKKIEPSISYSEDGSNENCTKLSDDRSLLSSKLVKNRTEWLNTKRQSTVSTKKTVRDSSTQYSNSYFTTDKEVEVQRSLMHNNSGMVNKYDSYCSPTTSSTQTLSCHPDMRGNLINNFQRPSSSYDTTETVMPDSTPSTTITNNSSAVLSDFSTYYDKDLKVPLNSPISAINVQRSLKEFDLSISDQNMDEISNTPITNQDNKSLFRGIPCVNVVQSVTLEEPCRKFINYSSTEEELYLTDLSDSSKEELKYEESLEVDSAPELKEDKTLNLLNAVRLKLESYLSKTYQTQDWCGLYANRDNPNKVNNMRNVSVNCNNPYEQNNEEIHKRCYEDDDEYYESRRKDVRRYFQNDNLGLLMQPDKIKKNFDIYLSGDNFIAGSNLGSIAYQTYPIIMNNQQKNMDLDEDSYSHTSPGFETIQTTELTSDPGKERVSSTLETELDTLQSMYDNLRLQMEFLIDFDDHAASSGAEGINKQSTTKSRAIENISGGLTGSIHELKCCLSTINQMLEHSTVSLQNISSTLPCAFEVRPGEIISKSAKRDPNKQMVVSDLFGGNLYQTSQLSAPNNNLPTPFKTISNHGLEENTCVPQLRSKTIYTGLPTTLEPTSTYSDLLYKDMPKEMQKESISQSDEDISELFPSFSELFDDHYIKPNEFKKKQPLRSENIGNIAPKNSELSTAGDNTTIESPSHINNIIPNASELFPDYNLFWDFSPQRSKTNLSSTNTKNTTTSQTLSAVADILSDSTSKGLETTMDVKSCVSSSEKSDTYFVMESEIERTIKELLKESGNIKESIILNGGKEDAEPPFSVEYIKLVTEDHPFLICKNIMEDIVNAVTGLEESNRQNEDDANGLKEDVKYLLDHLLEEIDNTTADKINKSRKELEVVNFSYNTSCKELCTTIQIGDAINQPSSSVYDNIQNDFVTCFCSTTAFAPKIPKTSFSFGETPSNCLKVQHSGCKIPVRRRDGLSTIGQEKKELGTSRIFTELLNLQSYLYDYEPNKNEDSLVEEEFSSALDIVAEFQKNATVSKIPECSTCFENNDSEGTSSLQMTPNKNSTTSSPMEAENNTTESANSEDNPETPPPENEDPHQSVSNQGSNHTIPKSQKCLQLTNSTNKDIPQNQPSTSKKTPTSLATTEEEEIIQDIDLTQKRDSSSEPEYFIPVKISGLTQKSWNSETHSSQYSKAYDTSSSEEVASHSVRKPRSKKKKNQKIMEIKPITSFVSDTDSEQFATITQPTQPMASSEQSLNSHIVLKPAQAVVNLQEKMKNCRSEEPLINSSKAAKLEKNEMSQKSNKIPTEHSSKNGEDVSDAEYEGDHETSQFNVPSPRYRYKSIQELNTPEEIALIEQNLRENDKLTRSSRIILAETDTSSPLEYDKSPIDSENFSRSEFSINTKQEDSEEINIINIDKREDAVLPQSWVPPKAEHSKSRSTI